MNVFRINRYKSTVNNIDHFMSFVNRNLKVRAKTWVRDSYGLYDYETNHYHAQNVLATRAGKITRVNNEVTYINTTIDLTKNDKDNTFDSKDESEVLAHISEAPEGIKIFSELNAREDGGNLWMVVDRGEDARGHQARPGDVIKLGRVMFKIKQFKVGEEAQTTSSYQKSILDSIREHMEHSGQTSLLQNQDRKQSMGGQICKICLGDKAEKDNPLISPCKCIGSVKYVHLECLQAWVKSKLNMHQNKNLITIFWKNLNCELCKTKLPLNVTHQGEELTLIPFNNRISGSYVVMESFSKDREPTGIHIIDLTSNQNFRMGRGHDCDLKISDISVSRIHAFLVVSKGKLYLKDNSSKFGTLVLKKDPIILNDENSSTQWIQCGRTLLKFTIKKPWLRFLPCIGALFKTPRVEPIVKEKRDTEAGEVEKQLVLDKFDENQFTEVLGAENEHNNNSVQEQNPNQPRSITLD